MAAPGVPGMGPPWALAHASALGAEMKLSLLKLVF